LIVKWFVNNFATRFGKSIKTIPKKALIALQGYPWPGNVRELENVIERSVIISKGPVLRVDLPGSPPAPVSESRMLQDIERDHILQVLEETRWKIEGPNGTAQILGLNPGTLRSRMKKLRIQRPKVQR
jgi:transcriptional regulator with GAF, ATPase, and Fis domain